MLAGKVAVVTGGSRGIGRATAQALAREGAAVVVAGRDLRACTEVADGIVAAGGPALPCVCDVSRKADVERLIAAAVEAFGGVDILVNNAGLDTGALLLDTTEEQWDTVLDTNLKGHFLCAVTAVPEMRKRGAGVIVNTSSPLATSTLPGCGAYTASKAGIEGLTQAMAVEWGPLGIRVNCVVPGSTDTAMMWAGLEPDEIPEARRSLEAAIPVGRVADPGEIAQATVWLCSPLSSFANGGVFRIDGGALSRLSSPR